MNAEISKEVADRLKKVLKANPETRIPLIITLEPDYGSDFSSLEDEGFHVDTPLHSINAVAGTAPANRIADLVRQPKIKKVEYDGEVRAL
jgi:hypothetical protein